MGVVIFGRMTFGLIIDLISVSKFILVKFTATKINDFYDYTDGFNHASDPSNIDMKAICLCFQVFLKSTDDNKYNIPLTPIVFEPIYNKDAMSDLKIIKLSKPSCCVTGGDDIILLCEKVKLN